MTFTAKTASEVVAQYADDISMDGATSVFGSDPLDPDSFMHMRDSAITPAGDLQLYMHTVAGRRYALDTTKANSGPWIP